jgi:hypothetical protein
VAIDVTGPFANAPHHQRFIVVLIDYTSSFPEILLTGDITSRKIINWLKQVFARFGNPAMLTSDNGSNFVSEEFQQFLCTRDIIHHRVPVYNPERNGKVEVFNRYLKHGVQTFEAAHKPFHEGIEELLFNYRATAPTAHEDSPAKRLFGREMRQNFQPNNCPRFSSVPKQQNDNHAPPLQAGPFKVADLVRKRLQNVPKGSSPFSSPWRVTEVLGAYTYKLDDGQVWNAKNLVKYVPKQRHDVDIVADNDQQTPGPAPILPAPPQLPHAPATRQPQDTPRQSQRHNKGVPPRRYWE